MYSDQPEAKSREALWDFELLRALFSERANFIEKARRDITVFFFSRKSDFLAYTRDRDRKRKSLAGFYLDGLDRAVIVLSPSDDRTTARQTVFHEYIHHLFTASEKEPPMWLAEGMAELMAGIRVEDDKLEIGHPVAHRLFKLQASKLLSLETLFGASHGSQMFASEDHTGLFYAQSWALLHYWYFGQSDIAPDAVERFVSTCLSVRGLTPVETYQLFKSCFDMEYAEMKKRLGQYVVKGKYRYIT
ncbi:MAG: hypothetical protein D6781_02170, partial [Verrucomicrobia bacterium]